MVLAGSPTAVSISELESVENELVEMDIRAEFIPQEDVPVYFAAANAVVFPYRRSFGTARPSGVFQKACAAGRPVIAPNFGMFARRVEQFSLGRTFCPEDPDSLAETISQTLSETETIERQAMFDDYISSQSYERLADDFDGVYGTVVT
jgi:glycosyltransferase involved in cell wall biosynthesis